MSRRTHTFLLHLGLFVLVELVFTVLIFRELPALSLLTSIGIVHCTYLVLVLIAGWLREETHPVWAKFLCTYVPIVIHVIGHVWVAELMVEEVIEHTHAHEEHSIVRIIGATIGAGILIALGEWLLHRKEHCDQYHRKVHKECINQHKPFSS